MKRNIYIANFTFFVSGFTSMILSATLPFIIKELHLNYAEAGMLLSFLSIGNIVTVYTIGFLINRFGKRLMACLAMVCSILSLMALFFSEKKLVALVSFFGVGICRGALSNINNSIVNDSSNGSNVKLNYLHMFFSLGACLGPIIAAFNTKLNINWKILIIVGVLLNIGGLYLYILLEEKISFDKKHSIFEKKEYSNNLNRTIFIICACILFTYIGIENSVNGWLVTYFQNAGIIKTETAQALLSFMYLIMVIGRILSAKLAKRIDNLLLMLISAVGSLFTYTIMIMSNVPIIILFSVGLIGLFFAPMYPYSISVCSSSLKNDSVAMGLLLTIGGLGKIFMPYLIGRVSDVVGIRAGMSVIGVAIILLIGFIGGLFNKQSRCKTINNRD